MAAQLARVLVDLAVSGDLAAIREVFDRVEGKPALRLSGDAPILRLAARISDDELAEISAGSAVDRSEDEAT